MKTILCYGDSNTWGAVPGGHDERYPRDIRWTGILQTLLQDEFYVVEEGLNGRTTVLDDPVEEGRNGKRYLLPCLRTHMPVDLVILMLGTNDLKKRFSFTPYDVARGVASLIQIIYASVTGPAGQPPRVIVACPAPFADLGEDPGEFEDGVEKSRRLAAYYAARAKEYDCAFLDAGQYIHSSRVDGIHLEADQHDILAEVMARVVREQVRG